MSHMRIEPLDAGVKPILRGYSHAVAAPLAIVVTGVLLWITAGDLGRQVAFAIYGVSLVLLFTGSATYHIGHWSDRVREVLRRLDHSNIFVFIAGTYTPITVVLLTGWWRVAILAAVWALAATGSAIAISGIEVPRKLFTGMYLVVGWVAVAAVPAILGRVGLQGGLFILAGGVLYSLGAVVYALRWPVLWRRVFSFHEVFHLFVIGASAVFLAFMLIYVVPR